MTTTLERMERSARLMHAIHNGRALCGVVGLQVDDCPNVHSIHPPPAILLLLRPRDDVTKCPECVEKAPGVVRMINRTETAHPPGAVIPF